MRLLRVVRAEVGALVRARLSEVERVLGGGVVRRLGTLLREVLAEPPVRRRLGLLFSQKMARRVEVRVCKEAGDRCRGGQAVLVHGTTEGITGTGRARSAARFGSLRGSPFCGGWK